MVTYGSRENILKAKLEMLEGITGSRTVIINNDNDLLHRWSSQQDEYEITTYGNENESRYMAYDIKALEEGSSFKVDVDGEAYEGRVNISGAGFVYNALSAIATGESLGIDVKDILEGVKDFEITKGRMAIEEVRDNIAVINDCYNASNDSTRDALAVLKNMAAMRRIAVLRRYA